ncbi:MAG: hypothetical protein K2X47_05070, partial [Bdellovibrionales bacterium]|nr:hypothetical protein [Bdellovibrionales bacterium]
SSVPHPQVGSLLPPTSSLAPPPFPLPIPFPFPFHPGPYFTFKAASAGGFVPAEPPRNPYEDWYEPGKTWYKINGQLQRILSQHTATSAFSPFLSASFSQRMGHAYGPILIVMDVCPERMLPNFELAGGYGGEEELYLPFFVLPEEIIRFEGRECWIARSKAGLDLLPPEERERYLKEVEKLCEATYPVKPSEPVNATTKKWRSYFRNFLVEEELNYWANTQFHIKSSQKIFYSSLAQGLKPSPLNPSGEMTLARWREIARKQVGSFQNCESSRAAIVKLASYIDGHEKEILNLRDRIQRIPDPRKDPQYWPLEPPWPTTDWRVEQIQEFESSIENFRKHIALEKSASSGHCGTR